MIEKVLMIPEGLVLYLLSEKSQGNLTKHPGKYARVSWNGAQEIVVNFYPKASQEICCRLVKEASDYSGASIIDGLQKMWRDHGINLWKLQKLCQKSPQKTRLKIVKWDGVNLKLSIPTPLKKEIFRY